LTGKKKMFARGGGNQSFQKRHATKRPRGPNVKNQSPEKKRERNYLFHGGGGRSGGVREKTVEPEKNCRRSGKKVNTILRGISAGGDAPLVAGGRHETWKTGAHCHLRGSKTNRTKSAHEREPKKIDDKFSKRGPHAKLRGLFRKRELRWRAKKALLSGKKKTEGEGGRMPSKNLKQGQ